MPYRLADRPEWVPDSQTLDALLSERNRSSPSTEKIKALQELDDAERGQTGLVKLGETNDKIEGDPFGVYYGWAGNVAHPADERMLRVMPDIFAKLNESGIRATNEIETIRLLLDRIPQTDIHELAQRFAPGSHVFHPANYIYSAVVTFQLGKHRVRLMQTWTLDRNPHMAAPTCRRSVSPSGAQASMSIGAQQYMMASMMNGWDPTIPQADDVAVLAYLRGLRHEAQYRYWFETDPGGRDRLERESSSLPRDGKVQGCLDEIRQYWPETWTGGHGDPDHFLQLAEDQMSARSRPTELMDEDIIVVTDRHHQMMFANFEKLAQLLLGPTTTNRLADCLDLWSFFTPLPAPEPARRVVDRHTIMEMHPELDMSKATIDTLAQAKVATAHYGTCAHQGGVFLTAGIQKTRDSKFLGIPNSGNCADMLPGLYQAAFGKASRLIRFLWEPLNPLGYQAAVTIFEKLPESRRISVRDDDSPDYLSRFSLGVNKESCNDGKGVKGGIAGLVTLGQYQGGELCIPNLGLRVPCAPGTTTLIGNRFNYYTRDCSGPRFVVTGSNEEACKDYAVRGVLRDYFPGIQW